MSAFDPKRTFSQSPAIQLAPASSTVWRGQVATPPAS